MMSTHMPMSMRRYRDADEENHYSSYNKRQPRKGNVIFGADSDAATAERRKRQDMSREKGQEMCVQISNKKVGGENCRGLTLKQK